MAHQYN